MIYVFLAEGFEESEAIVPIDCLRRAGCQVQTVGVGGTVITGSHGISVAADITEQQIMLDETLEMVFLPGGMPGTKNLAVSPAVRQAVQFCADENRYVAAICAAPSVLGQMGLLHGKKATCYAGYEKQLQGATFTGAPVTVDGRFITGRSAGTTLPFGLMLVEQLRGAAAAVKLAQSLMV